MGYLIGGISLLLSGYSAISWIYKRNKELKVEESLLEEKFAVEDAIDHDDYANEIKLLEKNVMENDNFTIEYALILHFSYVKLKMFGKADILEKRMI